MPRYKLTIAYDGTDFCGWQKQEPPPSANIPAEKILAAETQPSRDREGAPTPLTSDNPATAPSSPSPTHDPAPQDSGLSSPRLTLRTVQEVTQRAIQHVVREPISLIGASRTDAGVHARGQVAAFTCSESAWPVSRDPSRLILSLNSRLPPDILITAAEVAAPDFNPIRHAVSKAYTYSLYIAPTRPLFERSFVHYLWSPLDIAAMNAAAERFRGEHDFAAFTAAGHGRLTTTRTIFECKVTEEKLAPLPTQLAAPHPALQTQDSEPHDSERFHPRRVTITVSGSGFLYNMVRIIAGTLVEAGRGKFTPDDVTSAINSKDRRNAGPTLPPTGLCLEWIRYE